MLRKPSSARTEKGAADSANDTGGKRSWAAMRARLRHGREPIFAATAGEPAAAKPASTEARKDAEAPAAESA